MLTGTLTKIILAVVIFGAIMLLTNMLVGGASSFSNAMLCHMFSNIRHTWESVCLDTPIGDACIADSTEAVTSMNVPLVGCGTNRIAFTETTVNGTADLLADEASMCWNKFGSGKLNVLWMEGENPSMCSSFFSNLGEVEMTAKDITERLKSRIYGTAVNCTDSDVCCEPGFYCDETDTRYCSKEEANPYRCLAGTTRGTYNTCESGYQEVSIVGFWECINKLPDLVCDAPYEYDESLTNPSSSLDTEACQYETSKIEINRPDIFIPFEGEPPSEPNAYLCKLCRQVVSGTEIYALPNECTLLEDANPEECTVEITYADFLGLGTRTYFSFKRATENGGYLVEPDDATESVSGHISIFVEYLDSFTGTRKSDAVRNLPQECAAGTFLDSCNGCLEPCLRTLGTFAYLGFGGAGIVSKIGTLVMTDFRFKVLGVEDPLGVTSCLNCLAANAMGADLLACEDKLLICVYQY